MLCSKTKMYTHKFYFSSFSQTNQKVQPLDIISEPDNYPFLFALLLGLIIGTISIGLIPKPLYFVFHNNKKTLPLLVPHMSLCRQTNKNSLVPLKQLRLITKANTAHKSATRGKFSFCEASFVAHYEILLALLTDANHSDALSSEDISMNFLRTGKYFANARLDD